MVDIDVRVSSHFKEELAWTVDKRFQVISSISKKAEGFSYKGGCG